MRITTRESTDPSLSQAPKNNQHLPRDLGSFLSYLGWDQDASTSWPQHLTWSGFCSLILPVFLSLISSRPLFLVPFFRHTLPWGLHGSVPWSWHPLARTRTGLLPSCPADLYSNVTYPWGFPPILQNTDSTHTQSPLLLCLCPWFIFLFSPYHTQLHCNCSFIYCLCPSLQMSAI